MVKLFKKGTTKKELVKIVNYLAQQYYHYTSELKKAERRINNPPKKYKINGIHFNIDKDGICKAGIKAENDFEMNFSGGLFYCVDMLKTAQKLGFYVDYKKEEKEKNGN